jgi:diguanylate cyclase (GGDEF)-like protein
MNERPFTILLVSPDRNTLRRLGKFLDVFGYDVRQATDDARALAAAQAARPDFLILDATGGAANLALTRQIRRVWPHGYTYTLVLADPTDAADITAALEAGCDDFLKAPVVFGELLARLRAGARVIEFERRLECQSGVEPITGLADRSTLAAQWAQRPASRGGPLGWLALVDLDYFFRVADQFGRPAANELLRAVAELVQNAGGPDASIASLGDDRLAVLLPNSTAEVAVSWGEEALRILAGHGFAIGEQAIHLTASCGITQVVAGEALEAVLDRAQKAVQLAKLSGRGCVATSDEVAADAEAWTAQAADGQLFQTTTARDVMQPCPLLLSADETVEQASALLELTALSAAPVIDGEGRVAGLVTVEQLAASKPSTNKPRGGNSVRLVRHVMASDVQRFEELTPLSRLLEFFTSSGAAQAVVVRDKRPRGIVHCQGLAALNDKLTAQQFAATDPPNGSSQDLLVPDLALAE